MGEYIVTSQAEADLTEALLYLAEENVDAALHLHRRFQEVVEMLARHPEAGRERPELGDGIRSFPLERYILLYRLWTGDVAVVRIQHASRDPETSFG